jgi:hypothetical protein
VVEPTIRRGGLTADRSTTELLRIRQLKTSYPAKTEKQLPLSTGPFLTASGRAYDPPRRITSRSLYH